MIGWTEDDVADEIEVHFYLDIDRHEEGWLSGAVDHGVLVLMVGEQRFLVTVEEMK